MNAPVFPFAILCGALTLTGCGGAIQGTPQRAPLSAPQAFAARTSDAMPSFTETPSLISVDYNNGVLEYWPISTTGGKDPTTIAKGLHLGSPLGMAANGNTLVIANQYPPRTVIYNVATKKETILPDMYGIPVDAAIDQNSSIYILNDGASHNTSNVIEYPQGATTPVELECNVIETGEAIALDNEGDLFIAGLPKNAASGVYEIPNGPAGLDAANCARLPLKYSNDVIGLAIDPYTDNLLALDDPDQCAGGLEGRLIIYPKPYEAATGKIRDLGANCAGGLRLNAQSTMVFYGDEDVSGSYSYVDSSTYPGGKHLGTYYGGDASGFTTVPNVLPN
jgi:hypothetical protein